VHALGQLECEGRPRCYEISSHRSRSRLCSCPPPRHLLRRCTESGRWRVTGTGMASCLATVHPSGSNGNRRGAAGQSIGMVARAFIEGVGTAVGSAHAGLRRRSEMYGTAADSEARPNWTLHRSADGKRPQRGARRGRVVSQSFADRDAAYSPTVARHDALPNRIANACVAVVGIISAVIRIKAQAQTKPNSRAAKTAATEATATAETATTASATGKGRCAGRSQ
jgi:hypothetical protein